jgi:hypothetical protein
MIAMAAEFLGGGFLPPKCIHWTALLSQGEFHWAQQPIFLQDSSFSARCVVILAQVLLHDL